MSNLVTIFGGSGFLGRYIARRMAKQGWRVRVAVRRPNEAMFVKPYGTVGQVEPVLCNIRNDASVLAAMQGADAVVNCVGILLQTGKQKFDAVQHHGAECIARNAAASGINKMVHISALGADENGASEYGRSKALGEAAVLQHMPDAVILRPSVLFGSEDGFFNRFAAMARFGPVLSLVGGQTKFQPVYVDDVAAAAQKALEGQAGPGVYQLGGPDVQSLHQIVDHILGVIHRRRLVVNLPFWVGSMLGWTLDLVQKMSLGLIQNGLLTRDQVHSLKSDNIVAADARTLADMGIKATAYAAVVPDYLWRYRPAGQYDAIMDSAKNLKL